MNMQFLTTCMRLFMYMLNAMCNHDILLYFTGIWVVICLFGLIYNRVLR